MVLIYELVLGMGFMIVRCYYVRLGKVYEVFCCTGLMNRVAGLLR
jgi:hypothetical protein